jgi:hypothetical protein
MNLLTPDTAGARYFTTRLAKHDYAYTSANTSPHSSQHITSPSTSQAAIPRKGSTRPSWQYSKSKGGNHRVELTHKTCLSSRIPVHTNQANRQPIEHHPAVPLAIRIKVRYQSECVWLLNTLLKRRKLFQPLQTLRLLSLSLESHDAGCS